MKAPAQALSHLKTFGACDGTGRINYQGKLLVFVGTVDAIGKCHLIGAFLLTKGEAADELTRGLKAIKHAIEVIHQAMLTLDKPFYDAKTLGPDYRWDPTVTMNDGSDAILKSWRAIRGT